MADFNSSLPVRTENAGDVIVKVSDATTPSQQLAVDSSGRIIAKIEASNGDALTDTSGSLNVNVTNTVTVTATNLPTTVDTNYGTVGASTLRGAAQIGNATGAANFNSGATGAQTLRVEANQGAANATPWNQNIAQIAGAVPSATNALPAQITVASAFVSPTNPFPVYLQDGGTSINNYNTAAAVAAGATSNHDYTVTAAKTLHLEKIWGTASGKLKVEVQLETGAATNVFNSIYVGFNSTATPNISIDLAAYADQVAGARVRVIRTNDDKAAMDVYSTISGHEQ